MLISNSNYRLFDARAYSLFIWRNVFTKIQMTLTKILGFTNFFFFMFHMKLAYENVIAVSLWLNMLLIL